MVSSFVLVLMTVGSVAGIVCNFMTIKMHHKIPMPFYLLFPSMAVIIGISTQILLPFAVNVYEVANLLKQGYKKNVHFEGDMKYMKRRVRAIKVLRVYGGLFQFDMFGLKRSTKSTYFDNILSYTINLCLTVDV